MSDWNTLHIFDDRYFYEHLVADFKDKGNLFKQYMDSLLGKSILWDNSNSEVRTQRLVEFCRQLRPDFKSHEMQDDQHFRNINADVIEDINQLLTLIIFSECASFNPHFVLGRRIFTGNVAAKARSVASDVILQITDNEFGSISNCGGPMNWITYEELQLLWLDKDNLQVGPDGNERYLQEFLEFIDLALQHECGFISVTNVNERVLNMIENPRLKINVNPKEKGWKSVITFTGI